MFRLVSIYTKQFPCLSFHSYHSLWLIRSIHFLHTSFHLQKFPLCGCWWWGKKGHNYIICLMVTKGRCLIIQTTHILLYVYLVVTWLWLILCCSFIFNMVQSVSSQYYKKWQTIEPCIKTLSLLLLYRCIIWLMVRGQVFVITFSYKEAIDFIFIFFSL